MSGARNIRAGGAYVEVFVRDNLQKGLDRAAARLNAFGQGVTAIGGGVLAAGAAMAAPFFGAIDAASDLEETMNKFNVVFGERSAEVKAWGDAFAAEVGRSKKEVAEFMGNTQDLLVPMGFEAGAAEEMSKQITSLAYDLASFNNMQDADTIRDLHAALTGSGEVMLKYGVIVNEAAIAQELLNKGLDPKTATNAQKAQARFAIILRGTTAAQGDAIRSAGGYANQMKALWARFDNARAALGQAVLPLVTKFINQVGSAASIVGQWIEQNQGLVRVVALVAVGLIAGGAALILFGGMAIAAGWGLSALSMGLGLAASMVTFLAGTIAWLASPIGLVIVGIVAAGAALLYFTGIGGQAVAFLTDRFGALWQWTTDVFGGIVAALKAGDISGAANIFWLALQVAWAAGIGQLSSLWDGFTNASLRAFDELRFGVLKIFGAMLSKIGGLMQAAGDFLGIDSLKEAAAAIDDFGQGTGTAAQRAIDQRAKARERVIEGRRSALQAEVEQAQAELNAAVAAAKSQAEETQKAKQSAAPQYAPPDVGDGSGSGKAAIAGTFSGAAAARFRAVSSPLEKQIADASQKTAENTQQMVQEIKRLKGPTFT